jgi:predicted N-acyltransferase
MGSFFNPIVICGHRDIVMKIGTRIEMRVKDRMEEINRPCWESIRDRNELITDPDYLKAVETSEVIECEYRYFEFYEDRQLICAMSGYVLTNDAALFSEGIFRKITSLIRKLIPGFLKARTLEIGSPVNLGLPVSLSPQTSPEQLSFIFGLLKSYARRNRIKAVLIRDFMKEKQPFEAVLSETGFKYVANLPNSLLKMEWASFQDYLSCFKSRYRQHARKRIKTKEAAGIRTVIMRGRDGLKPAADYAWLFRQVMEKSEEYEREFLGEQYHRAMFDHLKDCNYWLQYFKDNRLVFFAHIIVYRQHMIIQYVGMDYDVSRTALLYFNAFYDLIKFAIKNKIKTIEAGITTYRAKSELGFSIFPQRMYIWHKNPLLRPFIPLVFKATRYRIQECHHAFKDDRHQYLWNGKEMFIRRDET